jgi:hypothetical protein
MSPGKKGARGELLASAWLMKQGYEVFRNLSPNGAADLVAYRDNEFTRIDVKCCKMRYGKPVYARVKAQLKNDNVRLILVNDNGDCYWDDYYAFAGETILGKDKTDVLSKVAEYTPVTASEEMQKFLITAGFRDD